MNIEVYKELKNNKLTRVEIAKHFNVPEWKLKKWISANKLGPPEKVVNNPSAFLSITEESAYWGGFIAADGCLTDNGTLKICLNYDDRGHIEKLKAFLQNSHQITDNTDKYYRSEMSVKNGLIAQGLMENFNITPRKSLTYTLPNKLPDDMFRHYLRGLFDGDGCICESFSNKNSTTATLYCTLTGSNILVDELYVKLYNILKISGTIQRKTNHSVFKYCTNASKILLEYMYKNSTVHLDRKYSLYQQILLYRKVR
jgi:hypothetical protein